MSTEPATTEPDEPGGRGDGTPADGADAPGGREAGGEGEVTAEGGTDGKDDTDAGDEAADGDTGESAGDTGGATADGAEAAPETSEAQAELAAQRLERERIERRKAEKTAPIASGAGLSGTAADLLAAVRAVEGGQKPTATAFAEPDPVPRRPAPEAVRRPQPVTPAAGATAPSEETVEDVRAVLAEGGAPEALVAQVADALGEGAGARLRADPWQLLRVAGVRPEQADGFARALLGAECGPDDERRGRAVTGWLLEQAALAGHTALEAPALESALAQRSVPDPDEAVQSAVAEGEALVFQDALDDTPAAAPPARPAHGTEDDEADAAEERPVRVLVGLERYALAEESLADGLARVMNALPKQDTADWASAAASAPRSAAELIRAVAGHGLVLHTGGEAARAEPAALLTAARALGLRAYAATHAADGRRRLVSPSETAEGPGTAGGVDPAAVTTLAGLLSGAEGPGRDGDGALALDLLVVLDAPQLDVETAALLVESLPDGARLVLSGDPGVLWSAGPGRVFADLLAARVCPQIASRTPDPGPVGELVSGIGIGELNQVEAPGKEVVIVPVRDAGEAVHRTAQLVVDSVPRAFGIPAEQVQVITPGHGGAAGTRALNTALKERLNPGPGRFGGFDPGDRVAYSPTPGRSTPGRVVRADAEGLHLECAGTAVVVPKERVEQTVRHGWALTAHQAVGQRWPAAVVVLPGDAARLLTRPWVYTAFGRAERHLSVVHGVEQALPRAVAETPAKPRTTRLQALLRAQVPPAG
ncbi:helix-hairpin-helix domain-containing protein [Streptomyces scabiei]|uniref:helix-hairpin-helix domain-containing protein n=1 Tax=Streptomyces scabiei TaxID=1930 RepID=UPI001B31CE06|nr:helix-hairpin-helix domain-containing protein [Streptomyces scabiei]MBP5932630.1 DNA helicase RecD [Streptomyces sp. LBUM 1479]MDX2535410.1 helix-hairpin-helix domain-containing protein [Streptomyces scabiei]MDX2798551.1 helix-hairpin-helix domain-containing protein [Streptomyces scabiei]MDX2858229.1 helix-hairpin-helix domain-containing protein [Streptomyces scabiei]MDX3827660.1 helix-hairpin-helix domain-containing protein [Streptomyces scabiei]